MNVFVTDQKLSDETGLSVGALQKYRELGKVQEGTHYFYAANRRCMWIVEKFNEWLISENPSLKKLSVAKESKFAEVELGSRSRGKAKGFTKQPSSSQLPRV